MTVLLSGSRTAGRCSPRGGVKGRHTRLDRFAMAAVLRFADDILISATSKRQLTIMLQELVDAVGKLGLVMHAGKRR